MHAGYYVINSSYHNKIFFFWYYIILLKAYIGICTIKILFKNTLVYEDGKI